MGKQPWTLEEELAELERTDPVVARAAANLERAKQKIIASRPPPARIAEVMVIVTRDGRVRARLDIGKTRIRTVPRESVVECMADVTAWLTGCLDTEWPKEEVRDGT